MSGIVGAVGGVLGDNKNKQSTTDTTSQSSGTTAQQGSNVAQSTPFLQWLATQTANNGQGGFGPGNAYINNAARPTTAADIGNLAYPEAAQQYAASAAALAPQFALNEGQELGRQSKNPYASSNVLGMYGVKANENQILGKLAQDTTANAWQSASSTALANAAREQGSGSLLNQGWQGYLSSVPGLINSAGATNVGQNNTTGQQTQIGTQHQVGSSTEQGYNGGDILGGGLALAGDALAFLKHGGAVKGYHAGGAIPGYWTGGAPQPMGGTAGPGAEGTPMRPFMSGPMPPQTSMTPSPMGQPAPQPQAPMMPFSGQLAPQGGNAPGAPPNPMLPRFASGGAVAGSGVASDDFSSKVMSAFKAFHSMRKHAQDGGVMEGNWNEPSPTGSESPPQMPSDASWMPVVERAGPAAPAQRQAILPRFQAWAASHGRSQPAAQPQAAEPDPLAQQASSLRSFMGGLFKPQQTQPAMGAADGGTILPPFGERRHFEGGGAANFANDLYGPPSDALPDIPDADVAPRMRVGAPYASAPDEPPRDVAEKLLASAGYDSSPFDVGAAPAPRRGAPLYAEPSLYANTPSTGSDYLRKAAYTISNMGGRGKVAEGIMKAREDERAAYAEARAERAQEAAQFGSVNGRQTMAGEMHTPALTVAQVNARAALEQEKYNQQYRAWLASREQPTPAAGPGATIPQARYNTAAPLSGTASPAAPELPPGIPPPPASGSAAPPDALRETAKAVASSVLPFAQAPEVADSNWRELMQDPQHGPAIQSYFEKTGQVPRSNIEAARMLVAGAHGAAAPAPPSGAPSAQRAAGLPEDADAAPRTAPTGQTPPTAPPATPDMTLDNVAPPQTARAPIIQDPDQREAYARLMNDKERLNKMIELNQPGADSLDKRIMEAEKMKMYPIPGKGFVPLPGYAEGEARAAAMKTGADKIAEENAKYHTSLSKGIKGAATVAANQAQNIDVLEKVMADPNFQSGTLVNWNVATRKALATAGYNPDASKPNEVFNMIMGKVLQDQFAGLKSLSSEAGEAASRVFAPMLAIEEKSLPHESDSLEGKRMKVALLKNMGELQMRWADKVNKYEAKYGQLDPNFDMALRNEIAKARIMAGVTSEDERRAEAALKAKEGGAPAAGPVAPAAIREQLKNLPDGVHDTPRGRLIKQGNKIIEAQGPLGSPSNPFGNKTDVQEAGQHAYDQGKIWKRNNNWLTNRWDEVQQPW